jgi:hypothetical protein
MKNLKEEVLKILKNKIIKDTTAREITSLVESNYNPKEFTEWCIVNGYKCYPYGFYGACDTEQQFTTLPELFTYWKENVSK